MPVWRLGGGAAVRKELGTGGPSLCSQVRSKMSLVAVPFYQKRHKHFDQSYRNVQTRYLLDEYAAKK